MALVLRQRPTSIFLVRSYRFVRFVIPLAFLLCWQEQAVTR